MRTALDAPRDFGSPFHSQGILVTGATHLAVVSGQVGVRPDGTVGRDVAEQTRIAMENVDAVLAQGGMSLTSVTGFTVYLTDPSQIADFVAAGSPYLPDPRPAATLLIVPRLAAPGLWVQIAATAAG